MPRPENVIGRGNRFSSSNQPANRGRKPKLYALAQKGYDIGIDDFREVCKYLIQCNKKELEDVMSNPDTPMWVVNIARAIHKDTGAGQLRALNDIFDRLFGKAAASMDINANVNGIEPPMIKFE